MQRPFFKHSIDELEAEFGKARQDKQSPVLTHLAVIGQIKTSHLWAVQNRPV
jgi:hypothetical protein